MDMNDKKPEPKIGLCGHPVTANGNCFQPGCWNHNSKRHEGRNP